MKNCLGIEIGHYRVKIAYMEHGELQTYVSERLETENQTDMKVYAELIKDVLKENNIRCKNAVFVLRQDDIFFHYGEFVEVAKVKKCLRTSSV